MTCPNCGSDSFIAIDGIQTDKCVVCYRKALDPRDERTAWRCHHCKTLHPWSKNETMLGDRPYCDVYCHDARADLIAIAEADYGR